MVPSASSVLFDACSAAGEPFLKSGTWGENDPLTLLWLYELLVADSGHSDLCAKVVNIAETRIDAAFKNPEQPVLLVKSGAESHVFPLLRLVQLRRAISNNESSLPSSFESTSTEQIAEWFENQIYTQLSLSEIKNSEFDPATLIFALQGRLTLLPN